MHHGGSRGRVCPAASPAVPHAVAPLFRSTERWRVPPCSIQNAAPQHFQKALFLYFTLSPASRMKLLRVNTHLHMPVKLTCHFEPKFIRVVTAPFVEPVILLLGANQWDSVSACTTLFEGCELTAMRPNPCQDVRMETPHQQWMMERQDCA